MFRDKNPIKILLVLVLITEQNILDKSNDLLRRGLLVEAQEYTESNLKTFNFNIEKKLDLLLLLTKINSMRGRNKDNIDIAKSIISQSKAAGLIYHYYNAKILQTSMKLGSSSSKDGFKQLSSLEKALVIERKLNTTQKAQIQVRISLIKGRRLAEKEGKLKQAIKILLDGLEIAKTLNEDSLIGSVYNHLGNTYNFSGNTAEALKCFNKTIQVWEKTGNVIAHSNVLHNTGIVYATNGDLDRALEFFTKGLELILKTDNKENIVKQLNNIGYLYHQKGELDLSFEYYQKALPYYIELKNENLTGTMYLNFGKFYQRKGELDSSLEYLNKAKKIFDNFDNPQKLSQVFSALGEVSFTKMDFGKAKQFFDRSVKYSEKNKNNLAISQSVYQLIRISLETNSMKQAKEYLDKLNEISDIEENKYVIMYTKLAQAFVLQAEQNTSDELSFESLHTTLGRFVKAKDLIGEIINGEVIDYERIVEGIFNLCELLIIEMKILGNEDILDELDLLTKKLLDIGESQNAFSLLAKTYLLRGKLALLKPDLTAARKLFEEAQQISEEKGYKLLAKVIKEEHKKLDSSYDELVDGKESTLLDRLGAIKLDGLLFSLKQNRVETYSVNATTSAPSMKDLAGFAQSLQKRKIGW